ncbi:hypothetical protein [Bacillus thuringiensis]|uniref:hypothetical protein n=1 Tax=Bacillus thuringiensis TaxID=1428 RepID=UPI0018773B5D|nr:hypothetical protein [Bacillus thuringiensis]MBE5096008.1 hypothetical protein [Bacillus thuringiensis]
MVTFGTYEQDVALLVKAYRLEGYVITNEQAEDIWSEYSNELNASWMMMGNKTDGLYETTKKIAEKLKIIPPLK